MINEKLEAVLPHCVKVDLMKMDSTPIIFPKKDWLNKVTDNCLPSYLCEINIHVRELMHEIKQEIEIFNHFLVCIESQTMPEPLKVNMFEFSVYYFLLCVCIPNVNDYDYFIQYAIHNMPKNYTVLRFDAISLILKGFHDEIFSVLFPKNPHDQKIQTVLYRDILKVLKLIMNELQISHHNQVCHFISHIGVTPVYWPSSFKMRTRLFCNFTEPTYLLNSLFLNDKKYRYLYPCQYKSKIKRLYPEEIQFLLTFLPQLSKPIKEGDPLHTFCNIVYNSENDKKHASTLIHKPKQLQMLLKQFIVAQLRNWEIVWLHCKWVATTTIYKNIIKFRNIKTIPDIDFLKELLFDTR